MFCTSFYILLVLPFGCKGTMIYPFDCYPIRQNILLLDELLYELQILLLYLHQNSIK